MVKYTLSAINDTFDFIKKMLNIADLFIQLCYIMYVTYRVFNQLGNPYVNFTLLVLTISYLIYHLFMIREFYTKKQLKHKAVIRNCVKIAIYIINLYIIIDGVIHLYHTSSTDNMAMLMIVLMIIGYIFIIMFDIIRLIINYHVKLIESSILYDIEEFKNNHKTMTAFAKTFNVDMDKVPVVKNEKMRKRIIDTNYKQENKKIRKEHFNVTNNNHQ